MGTYVQKPIEVEATVWHRHGDHPYVRMITTHLKTDCRHCGQAALHHGVVDLDGKQKVICPGSWVVYEPGTCQPLEVLGADEFHRRFDYKGDVS